VATLPADRVAGTGDAVRVLDTVAGSAVASTVEASTVEASIAAAGTTRPDGLAAGSVRADAATKAG
jgi:hypothetical protein